MSVDRGRVGALASIAVAVAIGTAVGISVAPYMRWIVRVLLGGVAFIAVSVVYELIRRDTLAHVHAPPSAAETWLDAKLDPWRAKAPPWLFTWRGAVVILSPVWAFFLAALVLPFVMR